MDSEFNFSLEPVTEGSARFFVPKGRKLVRDVLKYAPSKSTVFYNPVMRLNRDLAVSMLRAYQKGLDRELTVCEPLGGCGVRSIRFALEVREIKKIVLNDINSLATKLSLHNLRENKVEEKVEVTNLNANLLLQEHSSPKHRFDVIDLDPFGSPAPFLDSTFSALKDGGLLAVTATDTAPLCGIHPLACLRKYGAMPLRTEYCHELAVRILLAALATNAARHDLGIRVLATHSSNHYVRGYVVARYGAKRADESLSEIGYILNCFNCFHRDIIQRFDVAPKVCSECGEKLKAAGPLWIGNIVELEFCVKAMRETEESRLPIMKDAAQLLKKMIAEANAPPTYYVIDKMCDKFGLPIPKTEKVVEMLERKGFRAIETHFNLKGLKTNASARDIKDALMEAPKI